MGSSPLDVDRILRETFLAAMEYHASIGSTNDRARQCAAEAVQPLPLLIAADVQTAGRGRGSKRWWTGRGALAFTLLVDLAARGVQRRWWSLSGIAAGVAVAEAIAPRVPDHTVGLHWPNDVYVAGRKLAGVLVETFADRLHAIGIGVNTNNPLADAPAGLQHTAASLRDLAGEHQEQTAILVAILQNLERCLLQLAASPEQISARADALCLQRGQELTLQIGRRRTTGRCVGIASDGALLLDTPRGLQRCYSGAPMPPPTQ